MNESKPDTPSQGLMRPAPRSFSLMPSTMGEAMEMAKIIAESDFAPKDYKGKPGNVMIAVQMGADVGLKPMQALQNIAVINGRPAIWGDAALALVQSADILERFHETIAGDGDNRTATCTLKRRGLPDEIVRTFSVKDAKQANLWAKQGPWSTYPDRMLQMRARGFCLRDGAADRLMGLVLAEEAGDYVDAEVIHSEIVPPQGDPLDRIPEGLRPNVAKAFETLGFSTAQGLVKINEFLGKEGVTPEEGAKALLEWCKDEFSKRRTGQPRRAKEEGNAKPAAPPAPPSPEPSPVAPPPPAASDPAPSGGGSGSTPEVTASEVKWGPSVQAPTPPRGELF